MDKLRDKLTVIQFTVSLILKVKKKRENIKWKSEGNSIVWGQLLRNLNL